MKEYERVTREYQFDCSRCEDRKCTKDSFCCDETFCKIYNRLAELEDDIENNRCIILPFLVGQDVFIIKDNEIIMGVVNGIWWQNDFLIEVRYNKDKYGWRYTQKLKNEIFSTKPEAEKKLAELKGE